MEPTIGLEPMTCRLRIGCSTTELRRRLLVNFTVPPVKEQFGIGVIRGGDLMRNGENVEATITQFASGLDFHSSLLQGRCKPEEISLVGLGALAHAGEVRP